MPREVMHASNLYSSRTIFVAGLLSLAHAVLVLPNSPCAVSCGNSLGATSPSDIACHNADFSHDDPQIFAGCLKCEMSSRYYEGNQSDVKMSLYNMRYAVSSCLWGKPDNVHQLNDNPCLINKACEVFEDAIMYHNLSSEASGYEYCDLWDVGDLVDFKGCTDCLQADSQTNYLANFVTMLQGACEQKPASGVTVAVEGSVFSDDNVNITSPTPMVPIDPAWFDHGTLNLGAKVGIAVGGFVFLLIIAGFIVVCNGKRRRKAFLKELNEKYTNRGWPMPANQGDTVDTPMSQQPMRGFEDSPTSPNGHFQPYISPYQSQYNSPVSAQDMTSMTWPQAALSKDHNVAYTSYHDQQASHDWETGQDPDAKGKGVVESYELHDVESSQSSSNSGRHHEVPALDDPGHWRTQTNESYHEQLTHDDTRRNMI